MGERTLHLLAGLGNPGSQYERTRHNIGFLLIDRLAERFSIPLAGKKTDCSYGRGTIEGYPVILAKPQAFMNRSGPPLRRLADYFRIPSQEMLVIHDDIDLAFERIKIKVKGGDGGHKGVRSIIAAFGTDEFARVRIGVGRGAGTPGDQRDMTGHVLGRFSGAEARQLDRIIDEAAEAVVAVLCQGATVGMNRFNKKAN
jgi:PTH1 family peptidyl-tRNA hydrolase